MAWSVAVTATSFPPLEGVRGMVSDAARLECSECFIYFRTYAVTRSHPVSLSSEHE